MRFAALFVPMVGIAGIAIGAWAPCSDATARLARARTSMDPMAGGPDKPWHPDASGQDKNWAVILGGDTDGYLSPCGCTEPMSGGIRRRASATRRLAFGDHTVVLDNGSLAAGTSRQDQFKAQTMAQALAIMKVAAINFGPADARLGFGMALSLKSLSGNRLASSSVQGDDLPLKGMVVSGPFVVAAVSTDSATIANVLHADAVPSDSAVTNLIETAQSMAKAPILLLQGDQKAAESLARRFPGLALIQYRSSGDPPERVQHVGRTVIATCGERGKSIVRVVWNGRAFTGYTVVRLGPGFKDDPTVSRYFESYLARVDQANLLGEIPRRATAAFSGSAACAPCHRDATRVWKRGAHSHALATLEAKKESRDPDCVSCHVTGLTSSRGFRSRLLDPQLSFVGCESCHGPALSHVLKPRQIKLPKVEQSVCVQCHTTLNSPGFEFKSYWARIRH